jgi:hypothetical protein
LLLWPAATHAVLDEAHSLIMETVSEFVEKGFTIQHTPFFRLC